MRFLAMSLAALILSCQSSPIVPGQPVGKGTPQIPADSPAVLFTCLVREVSVARSQGIPWYIQLKEEDAKSLKADATKLLRETIQFQMIPDKVVRDHDLVRAGRFPFTEEFYLSPDENPIVRDAKEQELMLRTAPIIGADYYVVLLLDHSTSKVLLRPSSVTATAQIQIFHKKEGLIYTRQTSATSDALPYDRDMPLDQFKTHYRNILNQTATKLLRDAMAELQAKMKTEIRILPAEPRKNQDATPIQI